VGNGNGKSTNGTREYQWRLTKEKILLFFGLCAFVGTFIDSQFFGHPFHFEYLLGALACCGIAIAQWGDKAGKG
jgi:hypothetical protein